MNEPEIFSITDRKIFDVATSADGPAGRLPLSDDVLSESPSGYLFGMTQDAGMGFVAEHLDRERILILSTAGGIMGGDGKPIALGYHTGHYELGLQIIAAARELKDLEKIPYSVYCSDPCDGRTQGTIGMFDSLPYRNDAAIIFRRLARSLPGCKGILGVATCDKGLPAMMMALCSLSKIPSIIVPGGVTLPPKSGEDAGAIQTIGARYSHGLISLEYAAEAGCRACATPGGGCQFLGTAATAQVIAEALGIALPHTALAPSGQAVWLDSAVRSARAIVKLIRKGLKTGDILTHDSIKNAMVVHAAFGGSTNLVLHIPAIAHSAGLPRPTLQDWISINRQTPRLVSVLPNGPIMHPTVRVFLAGGVPEVMSHLRRLSLIKTDLMTVSGCNWDKILDEWEKSDRRKRFRDLLYAIDGVDPDDVIIPPEKVDSYGIKKTLIFPYGNIAPQGSLLKATAVDPEIIKADGSFVLESAVKVFVSEESAIKAIKRKEVVDGDIIVIVGLGPMGTGMEETYQVTSALKFLGYGKQVALLTDGRFSGVSTGICIGHIGPEALAGGPIGKLRNGDIVRIYIDFNNMIGEINFIGIGNERFSPQTGAEILGNRTINPDLKPHPQLPDDTKLWAILQNLSGGIWGGCVYDVEMISKSLNNNTH